MKQRRTIHTEYGRLESVLIKKASAAFRDNATIQAQWQTLNFTAAPDLQCAMDEYHEFERCIGILNPVIHYLPTDEMLTLDSMYCRDAALATDAGIILCNMGKELRQKEPNAIEQYCIAQGIFVLGSIEAPGTLEGGDVAWVDERTLAVGHTYRTNKQGIEQLKKMVSPLDIEVLVVDLPHYRGASDVFHLMSVFSPIDRDVAVVYSPLMPISFREELLARSYHLIEVPVEEFDSMGCNVLAIAPRHVVMVKGNPQTKAALEKAGCIVQEYEGIEISLKGGGGPTCLTRPLMRSMIDTGFN